MEQEILTLKEAANFLKISIKTLYNWRSYGVISRDKMYKKDYLSYIRDKWIKKELIV